MNGKHTPETEAKRHAMNCPAGNLRDGASCDGCTCGLKWRAEIDRLTRLNLQQSEHEARMAKEVAELRKKTEALRKLAEEHDVTTCTKCGGTGQAQNGGRCCRVSGHDKSCQCKVCQWMRSSYQKENELIALRAKAEAGEQALSDALEQRTAELDMLKVAHAALLKERELLKGVLYEQSFKMTVTAVLDEFDRLTRLNQQQSAHEAWMAEEVAALREKVEELTWEKQQGEVITEYQCISMSGDKWRFKTEDGARSYLLAHGGTIQSRQVTRIATPWEDVK